MWFDGGGDDFGCEFVGGHKSQYVIVHTVRPSQHSGLLDDGEGRIERRDSCLAACDPTQNIHLTWIGEGASCFVVYNFKERVRTQVFVVVDVRLDPDALLPVDGLLVVFVECELNVGLDRKSTRLNSSHLGISYAVFCL